MSPLPGWRRATAISKGTLRWAGGYFRDDDGVVRARFSPTRQGGPGRSPQPKPWCPGVYRGRVEFRDFARAEVITFRQVGRFSFRVR